jgi:raffinose/stachyose/melibiose transport system permease protein
MKDLQKTSYTVIMVLLTGAILLLNLLPVYQAIANTFKSVDDYNGAGQFAGMEANVFLPPRKWTLSSIIYFFQETIALRAYLNTAIIAISCVVLLELIGSVTALILAQYKVRFTDRVVQFLIGGQAIPIVMTILTTFLITRALHWLDTYQGAIIALTAQSLPFTIYLFHSYYLDLPRELLDAAEVDGASFWQVFTKIVLPMSGTVVATVGILIFIGAWATYLIGLIILRKEQMHILSMVINNMEIVLRLKIPVFFASFVMFSLPMIFVARWAQRYISTGMLAGAVKE